MNSKQNQPILLLMILQLFKFFPHCVKIVILTLLLCKSALLWSSDNCGKPLPIEVYRPFVVVILSYRNMAYIEQNLTSAFEQKYPNFRIVYVDDNSSDGTIRQVKKIEKIHRGKCPFKMIINGRRKGAMANMHHVVSKLKDDEIVVVLDGDDWFANPYALDRLNRYYQSEDVWMSYGQYLEWPKKCTGLCKPFDMDILKSGKVKQVGWRSSHLRSYYAGLFKKIHQKDLKKEGRFIKVASDVAVMLPMLEMAREHAIFVPEILYVYNKGNPRNDCRMRSKEQLEAEAYVRQLPVYPALRVHPAGR